MSEDYRQTLDAGEGERVYGFMLESLDEYARAHFGMEEQCMFRYQCPAAGMNAEAHTRFVEAISQFRGRFSRDGFDAADARRLVDFVDAWLESHIARIDTQLKPCVEAKDGAGPADL